MKEAAVLENTAVFIYNKVFSYIFKRRKIWNPQSEFISDEKKQEFQGSPPLDTLHPEENGDAVGGFAKQSA